MSLYASSKIGLSEHAEQIDVLFIQLQTILESPNI